jgi:hypothetical protein
MASVEPTRATSSVACTSGSARLATIVGSPHSTWQCGPGSASTSPPSEGSIRSCEQ